MEISIHAAREGGDIKPCFLKEETGAFQSTPPVKAATQLSEIEQREREDFNPRRP